MNVVASVNIDNNLDLEYDTDFIKKYIKRPTAEEIILDYRDSINLFISMFFFGFIVQIFILLLGDKLSSVVHKEYSSLRQIFPLASLIYTFIWPLIFIFFRTSYTEDAMFTETLKLYIPLFMLYFIIYFFLLFICTNFLLVNDPHFHDQNIVVSSHRDAPQSVKWILTGILFFIISLVLLNSGTEMLKESQLGLFIFFFIILFIFGAYNIILFADCNSENFHKLTGRRYHLDEPKTQGNGLEDPD